MRRATPFADILVIYANELAGAANPAVVALCLVDRAAEGNESGNIESIIVV